MCRARPADTGIAARRDDPRERPLSDDAFDLDRFHAGDEALFTRLVRDCSPRLRPYLHRYTRTEADMQDLLQDVWLRAYRKRRTFVGRGSLFGWLLTIVRTVGMAAAGQHERDAVTEELRDTASAVDPDAGLLRDALRAAVVALPDRQRDVVLLRLVDGLSTAETARLLQCAEGTVKATLHQATRKLQELLKEAVS
ncbi:MAG TPA: RNA polymerase sigma factor [Longimicrobiales bacterium]|nr:RNA polymerase sigma factor [Longimicrobiales bacterium]